MVREVLTFLSNETHYNLSVCVGPNIMHILKTRESYWPSENVSRKP